jgi:hypothetical protein
VLINEEEQPQRHCNLLEKVEKSLALINFEFEKLDVRPAARDDEGRMYGLMVSVFNP